MNDINAQPVLSRQSFTLGAVHFLDASGTPYTPTTVEKRVVTEDATVITDWSDVGGTAGFQDGDSIEITADEAEIQNVSALSEKHIVLVVGDRETDSEIVLRVIFQVLNRELLP